MKKLGIILIIIVVAFGIYYLINNSRSNSNMNPQSSTPTENTAPAASQPAQSNAASVDIKNFSFSPSSLSVAAGTVVTWTNNDSVPHTVTSDSGSELSSGNIAPGQTYSHTFSKAGTYSYHCSIHPMMKASVTVTQ